MLRIMMACVLVVGCAEAVPIFVELPGMTPLSNVQRATWTDYQRADLRRQCLAAPSPLKREAAERMCACVVGTAPVYATMPMLEEESRMVRGKTVEQNLQADGLTAKIIMACGSLLQGR